MVRLVRRIWVGFRWNGGAQAMTSSPQASIVEEWLHSPLSTPFYSPHVEELPQFDLAIEVSETKMAVVRCYEYDYI
jgi:hypothetical protein